MQFKRIKNNMRNKPILFIVTIVGAFLSTYHLATAATKFTTITQKDKLDFSVSAYDAHEHHWPKIDAALKERIAEIEKRLKQNPDALKNFQKAQKNWYDFVDAEAILKCVNGQSIAEKIYIVNLINFMIDRIIVLDNYLNCPESDLSCPVPRN